MNHKPNRPQQGNSTMNIQILERLDEIIEGQNSIKRMIGLSYRGIQQSVETLGEDVMTALTDALDFAEQTASEDTAADESAKALLITLSDMVKALGNGVNDPALVARITALGDGIKARAASLAAAVVQNTPSAPGGSTGGISGSTGGV